MKHRIRWVLFAAVAIVVLAALGLMNIRKPGGGPTDIARAPAAADAPGAGRVTMIDLGATECIPCKMMAPIIAELQQEYAGKADIIFIDVWKDPAQAKKYAIRAIPTQIFFDREGREVFRHTGFMDKRSIVEKLTALGVS